MRYFDLSSEIRDALLKNEDISGTKECTGYLDKESEGKGSYRCDTTLTYSVRLTRPSFLGINEEYCPKDTSFLLV